MDKYRKVLNYLLDEIDHLQEQLDEAMHEYDYKLAHRLHKALYLKHHEFRKFRGIFDPVDPNLPLFRFPDKFIVNNKESEKALQYILGDLTRGKIKNIQMVFEHDLSDDWGESNVRFTFIHISSDDTLISLALQQRYHDTAAGEDYKYEYFQRMGWQIEDEEAQKLRLNISKRSKYYQEKLLEVLAKTYYEVIANPYQEITCYVHINTQSN